MHFEQSTKPLLIHSSHSGFPHFTQLNFLKETGYEVHPELHLLQLFNEQELAEQFKQLLTSCAEE
jgi:hypothetical protein